MAITIGQTAAPSANGTSLGFTAVAGRIILAYCSVREWNTTWTPGNGFSTLAEFNNNPSAYAPSYLFAKVAAGGETSIGGTISPNVSRFVTAIELIGATLTGAVGSATNSSGTGTRSAPTRSPAAGRGCIIIGGMSSQNNQTSVAGGYTGLGGTHSTDWPRPLMSWLIVPSASGTYTPTFTKTSNDQYSCLSALLYEDVVPGVKARALII